MKAIAALFTRMSHRPYSSSISAANRYHWCRAHATNMGRKKNKNFAFIYSILEYTILYIARQYFLYLYSLNKGALEHDGEKLHERLHLGTHGGHSEKNNCTKCGRRLLEPTKRLLQLTRCLWEIAVHLNSVRDISYRSLRCTQLGVIPCSWLEKSSPRGGIHGEGLYTTCPGTILWVPYGAKSSRQLIIGSGDIHKARVLRAAI